MKKLEYLKRLAKTDKLPHALLVSGLRAEEFVSQVFGRDIRKVHPDFFLVEPMKKEIQIGQIREVLWRLSLRTWGSRLKVAVIDQAHLMNQEAQGALLKTLEEPKGKSLIVLVCEYPAMLFETILSRVQKMKFSRPFQAPERELMLQISRIAKSDLATRFQYAEKIAKEPELAQILTAWLHYFRQDLIKNKAILQRILTIHYLISKTNVSARLALENLMLEL